MHEQKLMVYWATFQDDDGGYGDGDDNAWRRKVGVLTDGRVFVPAASVNECEWFAVTLALLDGQSVLTDWGHPYVPADWVMVERPDLADVCGRMAARVRDRYAAMIAQRN